MSQNSASLRFTIHPDNQLDPQLSNTIIALSTRAYEEGFTAIMAAVLERSHVLGWVDDQLVTHALWVTRWLQVGGGPLLRTAYVEAVVTDPAQQNRGFATALMPRVKVAEKLAYVKG